MSNVNYISYPVMLYCKRCGEMSYHNIEALSQRAAVTENLCFYQFLKGRCDPVFPDTSEWISESLLLLLQWLVLPGLISYLQHYIYSDCKLVSPEKTLSGS